MKELKIERDILIKLACGAREFSHSPYSHFRVGAALLCSDGTVFTGCNVENASYSLTNCAERTAFFKAVSSGKTEFAAIAVAGGEGLEANEQCFPCGACLQVMSEFCGDDFEIILMDNENVKSYRLAELFPNRFLLKK